MPKSRGRVTKKRAKSSAKARRTSASRVPGSGAPAGVIAAPTGDDRGRAARVRGPIDVPPSGAGRSGPTGMGSVTKCEAGSQVGSGAADSRSSGDLRAEPLANSRLQVLTFGCEPLKDARPQGLSVTYWFDAATEGDPYQVSIRFTGKHDGGNQKIRAETAVDDQPPGGDSFDVVRTLDAVLPGSGRIAFTARILGLAPGQWQVTATPVAEPAHRRGAGARRPSRASAPSWASGATTYGPVANVCAPGARLGVWPALVGAGAVVALITQAVLAAHQGLPVTSLLAVSLVACLAGLVGAKMYYRLTHRTQKQGFLVSGMCIQGFVIAAVGAIILGGAIGGLPIGRMLDVTAPGLLFGMSIGRLGCFFGGCCAGRPNAGRWALWSSDRTVGVRRLPVQLVESGMSAMVGIIALLVLTLANPRIGGAVFVGAVAANTFGRQLLFPMRILPRATSHGRTATMALSGLALVASVALAAIS